MDVPREITTAQRQRPKTQQQLNRSTKRTRALLIGTLLSILVLIGSATWVSLWLIQKRGSEGDRFDIDDVMEDKTSGGWGYDIDWHSAPDPDGGKDNFDFDEGMIDRDDVLRDDFQNDDYVVSIENINESEEAQRNVEFKLVSCPQPGVALTIDLSENVAYTRGLSYYKLLLMNSSEGILCTLVEADATTNIDHDIKLKPIGRSYNGGNWEPYQGLLSATNRVPLSCSESSSGNCLIEVPKLAAGRKYVIKSYEYSLGERDRAARFLEKTTFGATNSEIDSFVAAGSDPATWVKQQLQKQISSHRQFFRERATNYHPETQQMGTLSFGPCESRARYRKFVFMDKDRDRVLTIATSPVDQNYKILLVDGKFRSIITGQVKRIIGKFDTTVIPDGSYTICATKSPTSVGKVIKLRVGLECVLVSFDGERGNPIVKLDEQHLHLAERVVTIDDNSALPFLEDTIFYERTEMIQLVSSIADVNCPEESITGAPEVITIASFGNEFWIHTPFFQLRDNLVEAPLLDGGKSAVEETKDAPEPRMKVLCANAPRTFLNEDNCIFTTNACKSHDPNSNSGIACGSPYEVATKPNLGIGGPSQGGFDIATKTNTTFPLIGTLQSQKETVWLGIALKGEDQLRQRIAWALSQILVVSPDSVGQLFNTESYLTYYDIFVRNAFGNYFDVLKEVTFSPVMAEMLTYINGASTGFSWVTQNIVQHADENYARELLQLFSLGLYVLNEDGTIKTNTKGHEIRTYKNHDISEYAKVFVGFKRQNVRGNIESRIKNSNLIDPLRIDPKRKDHFPKLGMNNRYVGDGFPLCKDLPEKNFLKKGAIFRFLGSSPKQIDESNEWKGSDPVRISLSKSSVLSSKLCNKSDSERCEPMMKLVLDSDIECYGVECTLQELRSFEVWEGSNIWYEYVRPPCVSHAFYNGAQSIRKRNGMNGQAICGDPTTNSASTVCCKGNGKGRNKLRQETFSGERVTLDLARQRCSSVDTTYELCENPVIAKFDCLENHGCDHVGLFYWSSFGCSISAKINREGKVAVIHNPEITNADTYRMVTRDTEMFFRVDWLSADPDSLLEGLISDCAGSGCTNGDGDTCICPTSVVETPVFFHREQLLSAENILSVATIGSFQHVEENFQPVNGVIGVSIYPHDVLTKDTVFKVVDNNGQVHFRKNVKSDVRLGSSQAKFRNPVTFFSLSEPSTRDAVYEIDAALRQIFFHKNMAPFIAVRLAQRFGISNPSPRYVKSITKAFRNGIYVHSSAGMAFGSGQYGCLEATIAAILLDKETLDPILDADPMHGSIQEPYLKLVKILRSLEFRASETDPLLEIKSDLQNLIGQQSHRLPNVFSFFDPEFQPSGRVSIAGMRSPEAGVLSGPRSIQIMNALISFLKYGVASCYGGIGDRYHQNNCVVGRKNGGRASYDPTKSGSVTTADIIDNFATLLTSGRLEKNKREMIKEEYENTIARGKNKREARINAQQLIVTTPEFHTSSIGHTTGQTRATPGIPEATNIPYKAVILVVLKGGYDSFNVLVPKSCKTMNQDGKTVRDQYLEQRGSLAFEERAGEFDLIINATDQPCHQFSVHDELKIVKKLYDANDLAFFANAGIINNPGMTKSNYHGLTRSQLFSHNGMQHEIAKVDPYDKIVGTGIMGRAKDVLWENGHVVNTISIDNPSIAVEGINGKSRPSSVVGRSGTSTFAMRPDNEADFDIEKHARKLNGLVDEFSGIYGDTWSQQFITGIDEAEGSQSILVDPESGESASTNNYDNSDMDKLKIEHSQKWSTISKLIQKRDVRKVDRDFFFTELGKWDHHNQMKAALREQLHALNDGLDTFVKEAKSGGFWDNVTIVIASDFGRTLTPNSNNGTDHAWGGHYMVLGGDIEGGKIHGKYPSDLTPAGNLVDDRGRIIPTTSWDSIWNGVLEWTGITKQEDLDYCIPNRFRTINPVEAAGKNFPLTTADSLFRPQSKNIRRKK